MQLRKTLVITMTLLAFSAAFAQGQQNPSVYYLCIGSGNYDFNPMYPKDHTFQHHDQLPEAENSAFVMANLIKTYAKGEGIVLNSSGKKLLSKGDILASLEEVYAKIKKDNKPDPLLIVYYCGHGFVDSLIGSQFLLSGNYPRMRDKDTFDERVKENMYLLEMMFMLMMKQPAMSFKEMDEIFTSKDVNVSIAKFSKLILNITSNPIRCLVMLDCCRSHITNDGLNVLKLQARYGSTIATLQEQIFLMAVKAVEPYIKNAFAMLAPVVYSGPNMTAVTPQDYPQVDLPLNSKHEKEGVGLLCKKTLEILDQKNKQGTKALASNEWLESLITPVNERDTTPVISLPLDKVEKYSLFRFP